MIKEVYTGNTGSGKSLKLATTGLELLNRNIKYYKKTGMKRTVASRLRFSKHIEDRYGDFIVYWNDMEQLVNFKDCDILWDEISADLDSTQWEKVPMRVRWWFRMHDKYGVDIYATAQDFITIFNGFRRLTDKVFVMRKLIGSRRPSATRPKIKNIWGVVLVWSVKKEDFLKESVEFRYDNIIPDFYLIRRKYCEAYDTRQEIQPADYPPLIHQKRHCETCGYEKILHI